MLLSACKGQVVWRPTKDIQSAPLPMQGAPNKPLGAEATASSSKAVKAVKKGFSRKKKAEQAAKNALSPSLLPNTRELDALVQKTPLKKLGKVSDLVFSPDGSRALGFIIKRPDLLWMFKRNDLFLPLSLAHSTEIGLVSLKKKLLSPEKGVAELGVSWSNCILWRAMPVRQNGGNELGRITDVSFYARGGKVISFSVSDGKSSEFLVGKIQIPFAETLGYVDGYLLVKKTYTKISPEGGVAAKAGQVSAKAIAKGKVIGKKAGKVFKKTSNQVIDKGGYSVGKIIGTTKNKIAATDGMFGAFKQAFKEEYSGKPQAAGARCKNSNAVAHKRAGQGKSQARAQRGKRS